MSDWLSPTERDNLLMTSTACIFNSELNLPNGIYPVGWQSNKIFPINRIGSIRIYSTEPIGYQPDGIQPAASLYRTESPNRFRVCAFYFRPHPKCFLAASWRCSRHHMRVIYSFAPSLITKLLNSSFTS